MKKLLVLVALFQMAQIAHAQNAPPEALATRNLQVEVRQVRDSQQAQGRLTVQPSFPTAGVNISAQNVETRQSRNLLQQVLVLNGSTAAITLGNNQPLRLRQTFNQNGVMRSVAGTVILQTNSGFSARPVWRGGSGAELELSALQTQRGGDGLPQSAAAVTTIAVPLDEWATVAQSDDVAVGGGRDALRVEVRVSLR